MSSNPKTWGHSTKQNSGKCKMHSRKPISMQYRIMLFNSLQLDITEARNSVRHKEGYDICIDCKSIPHSSNADKRY